MNWFKIRKGVRQGCILSPCLFNLHAEYSMWNAGLDKAQAEIKIARRILRINKLRYADDTTLMAKSEEELKRLLMKVKEENEKSNLKLNIQKPKIMASGPITSWQIDGEENGTMTDFIFLGSRLTVNGDCSHEVKRHLLLGRKWKCKLLSHVRLFATPWLYSPWNSPGQNTRVGSPPLLQQIFPTQESNQDLLHCGWILYQLSYQGSLGKMLWTNLDSVLKSRDITLPAKVCIVKAMVFLVVIYGCESWTITKVGHWENWCFLIVVLKRTLESPLDCKEIKPVNLKGNQPWIFIGRTNAEAPIFWPSDAKNWLIGKDPDAGTDWRQEEKGATEDEMGGWHHWTNGHEFEQTLRDSEGQGSLVCCSPCGCKEVRHDYPTEKQQQLLSHKKEWNSAICNNVDGPRKYYTYWNVITCMWNL